MACFKPLKGYHSNSQNANGKRPLVFDRAKSLTGIPVTVKCGQCIGCRLDRSLVWAIRMVHEASHYDLNNFLTLTYDDENLPAYGSLHLPHFQKFLKRYRKEVAPLKIRFFHCGEYGEITRRPHYHAIIFGHDFADKYLWATRNGINAYRSDLLEHLWPHGQSETSDLTFESAAYVARYVTKKITGPGKEIINPVTGLKPYEILDQYGEIRPIDAEYNTMSRRPGIGYNWYQSYKSDLYPSDNVHIMTANNTREFAVPSYYDNQLQLENPALLEKLKRNRRTSLAKHSANNTPLRLLVRETVKTRNASKLVRNL